MLWITVSAHAERVDNKIKSAPELLVNKKLQDQLLHVSERQRENEAETERITNL